MPKKIAGRIIGFNYDLLDDEVAANVQRAARRIKTALVKSIIEVGKWLITAKGELKHGEFEHWVRAEFKWNLRTAQRYMAAAKLVGKNDIMSLLSSAAIHTVAAPSTPESVVAAVGKRLKKGKKVSVKEIKSMIKLAQQTASKHEQPASKGDHRKARTLKPSPKKVIRRGSSGKQMAESPPSKIGIFHMEPEVGKEVVRLLRTGCKTKIWLQANPAGDHYLVTTVTLIRPKNSTK